MNKPCQHIVPAIDIALSSGNEVYHTELPSDENKKLVVDLYDPITSEVKKRIDEQCPNLRFWEWKGVPHNPAEKGYTCDKCNVVLIFPGTKTPRISR